MKNGYGTHASTAGGGAGTNVSSTGKTKIRSTLTPVFGRKGGKRTAKRTGGRR